MSDLEPGREFEVEHTASGYQAVCSVCAERPGWLAEARRRRKPRPPGGAQESTEGPWLLRRMFPLGGA